MRLALKLEGLIIVLLFFFGLVFTSCHQHLDSSEKVESILDFETVSKERSLDLGLIRKYYNKAKILEFPFIFKSYGSDFDYSNSVDYELGKDTLFGESFSGLILGVLPDTSSYFGFILGYAGDEIQPVYIAFDKAGKKIESKSLINSCWHGCLSDCDFSLTIFQDLSTSMTYRKFFFEGDVQNPDQDCAEYPDKASGYVQKSKIGVDGRLSEVSKVDIHSDTLLLNPILHLL